jgi:hypothetical protein
MARFNMTKSMEDYKVTVERVAIYAKGDENIKHVWICKGSMACGELL